MQPGQLEIVRHSTGGGRVRLAVIGELDLSNVEKLRCALKDHQSSGRHVLLDLSELAFIDSTGLRLLLEAQADARRDGWNLSFAAQVTPAVERLLNLTSVRPLLDWTGDS